MKKGYFLLLATLLASVSAKKFLSDNQKKKTLHIVAHSHQDAGWGRTAMQYYNGAVDGILTNVFNYLW